MGKEWTGYGQRMDWTSNIRGKIMANYKVLILIIIFSVFLSGCVSPEQTTFSLDNDDSPNVYKIENTENTEKIIYKTKILSSDKTIIYQGVVSKFSMYPTYTIQFEDGYILTTSGLAESCNIQLGKINRITVLKRNGFIGGAWDNNIAGCKVLD